MIWTTRTDKWKESWHRWFAWHPIRIATAPDGYSYTSAWWEYVERRGCFNECWDYEYRQVTDAS